MKRQDIATVEGLIPAAEDFDASLWARALDGDREALLHGLESDVDGKIARGQRIASALAIEARAHHLDGPGLAAWRSRLRQVAAHSLMLEDALERTGGVLAAAGLRWAPLKGLDLASRVYRRPEERPTSDIDLLIAAADLERAREALLEAGWVPLASGARAGRYLREEGYAWQARTPSGVLVEVHFRLWGSVAEEAGDVMLESASEDKGLGAGAARLGFADAYVLAAFHLWLDPPPRRLGVIRDLPMIARAAAAESSFAAGVITAACRFDLELPVALAARWSAALWSEPACRQISERLAKKLRWSEKKWWQKNQDAMGLASYSTMTLARHLAGRRTRHGLIRLAWRRIWAHPGIVETAYDGDPRPFPLLRWLYQLRAWGLLSP